RSETLRLRYGGGNSYDDSAAGVGTDDGDGRSKMEVAAFAGPSTSILHLPSQLSPARIHRLAHRPHRRREAVEYGVRHDRVADVQFLDLGNRRHRPDVLHREAVAGVHREVERGGLLRAVAECVDGARIVRM